MRAVVGLRGFQGAERLILKLSNRTNSRANFSDMRPCFCGSNALLPRHNSPIRLWVAVVAQVERGFRPPPTTTHPPPRYVEKLRARIFRNALETWGSRTPSAIRRAVSAEGRKRPFPSPDRRYPKSRVQADGLLSVLRRILIYIDPTRPICKGYAQATPSRRGSTSVSPTSSLLTLHRSQKRPGLTD